MIVNALTLWQPWATLVALEEKTFETRSWPTDHRGPLAIHAATSKRGLELARDNRLIVEALADHGFTLATLPRGAVVCLTELIACFPVEDLWDDDLSRYERAFGNFSAGRFAWELRVTKVYDPPIPARGSQRLWEWQEPVAKWQLSML